MDEQRRRIISFENTHYEPGLPDFLIIIEDYAFWVHSDLFSEHSTFFTQVCSDNWKEGQTGELTLHDDSPVTVAWTIAFLYYGDSPLWNGSTTEGLQGLPNLRTMLDQARLVAGNASLSDEQWIEFEKTNQSTYTKAVAKALCMAEKCGIASLTKRCTELLNDVDVPEHFWDVLAILEAASLEKDKDMRELIKTIAANLADSLLTQERLKKWLAKNEDVGYSVYKAVAEKQAKELALLQPPPSKKRRVGK